MTLGIVPDMPDLEYHQRPELSSTEARHLLDSPARYLYLKENRRPDKPEFDLGSAIHSKVLGTGYEIVVIPDDLLGAQGAATTVAAKEFIAKARERGAIPVKSDVAATADQAAEAVLAHPRARQLFEQDGIAEASVFSTDPKTGVELRARFDWLAEHPVDLKSARSAAPDAFARAAANYGYDVQEGHYLDTLNYAIGEIRDLLFVVVETQAPYLVAVHELDLEFSDIGQLRARKAREIYAECQAAGVWPGYPDSTLQAPAYYLHTYAPDDEMVI